MKFLRKYNNFLLFQALLVLTIFVSYAYAEGGYGVTYGKMQNRVNIGLDFFGCSIGPSMKLDRAYVDPLTNETRCNPFMGDTSCSRHLPILCTLKTNLQWPYTNINNTADIHWSGSFVATSIAILGYLLKSVEYMNYICEINFGPSWRAYEFNNDGLIWYASAIGNLRSDTRFWIWNNNQPGNCWDR